MRMTPLVRRLLAALLLFLAVAILVPFGMRLSVQRYSYTSVSDVPQTDAALVLGASVVRGRPSPVLGKRADAAVALFRAGKVEKLLVTGDNSEMNYDEVTPVRTYMMQAGVPADNIFLDYAGFDTYSSMYRARDVFHVKTITIVTQDFHMPRALFIARHLGITAYGYVADGENGITPNYLREIPASFKALLDLLVHRTPQYLGEPVSLTEVSTTTPR